MSRKSVKENKNVYQLAREEAGLSREAASDKMQFVSDNRIESFESDKSTPHPEEVLAMAEAYKKRNCATTSARMTARSEENMYRKLRMLNCLRLH